MQYCLLQGAKLNERFNEHRRTIDSPNNKSKPTTTAERFLSSSTTCTQSPLKKSFLTATLSVSPGKLFFLFQKGRTTDLNGLNTREETSIISVFMFFRYAILFYRMLFFLFTLPFSFTYFRYYENMLHKNMFQCRLMNLG